MGEAVGANFMGREGWCILRVKPRHTLMLAETLAESGFDAWTPVEVRRVRIPRMNMRQIVKGALLKGFVFAPYHRRHDLIAVADGRDRHARFSFIYGPDNEIAKVSDRELDGLRWVEAQLSVVAKKVDRRIPEGVKVKVSAGLFIGMTGVVRRSKRGITLVCFNDRYSVEIPTSLLAEDRVDRFRSATGGTTALAA